MPRQTPLRLLQGSTADSTSMHGTRPISLALIRCSVNLESLVVRNRHSGRPARIIYEHERGGVQPH